MWSAPPPGLPHEGRSPNGSADGGSSSRDRENPVPSRSHPAHRGRAPQIDPRPGRPGRREPHRGGRPSERAQPGRDGAERRGEPQILGIGRSGGNRAAPPFERRKIFPRGGIRGDCHRRSRFSSPPGTKEPLGLPQEDEGLATFGRVRSRPGAAHRGERITARECSPTRRRRRARRRRGSPRAGSPSGRSRDRRG